MKPKIAIPDLLIGFGLLAIAALFWRLRIIAPASEVMMWSGGDLYAQIYPMAYRAAEWIRAGQVPLWNPFQSCGLPFFATVMYGVFYPLNFSFLVLPTHIAIEATAVLHLFLAGTFTYGYGRQIGMSRGAGIVAALVFMLSGFVVGQAMWFTPAITTAVWLPLGLLFIERLARDPGFGGSIGLAAAVGMPALAGWVQTWVYCIYALTAYAAVRLVVLIWSPKTRGRAVTVGLLVAAGFAIALALAAIQLLPSAELQRLGPRRPGGLSLAEIISMGVLSPRDLLSEALNARPGMPRSYVGIVTLLLIPLSLFTVQTRWRVLFFWCLGAFAVLVAISLSTPVFRLYLQLPTAAWFRLPQRILILPAFVSAVLAGFGFDALGAGRQRGSGVRLFLLVMVVSLAMVLWTLFPAMPTRSRVYLGVGTTLLCGALSIRAARPLFPVAIVALLLVDLFLASRNAQLHPYNDLSLYDGQRPVLDFIKERQGLHRTLLSMPADAAPAVMPKMGTLREIFSITDYEPLSLLRYETFCRFLWDPATSASAQRPFGGAINLYPGKEQLRLLDLLSVRFIVAARLAKTHRQLLEQAGWQVTFAPDAGPFMVYESPRPLPRAYVAYTATVADSEEKALAAIRSAEFLPRLGVVLEAGGAGEEVPSPTPPAPPDHPITEASITSYRPTSVTIEAQANAQGYVVLTDSFYPGWKATVDGRPVEILRANYLFRAVPVGPGMHQVVFEYDPISFKVGRSVTLAALGVIGVALLLPLYRKRGNGAPGPQ